LLLVSTCSHQQSTGYQGYVEGKFVYVASPESGRLEHLSVAKGDSVAAGAPLFSFENEPEASEVREARQLLQSAQSRLVDLQSGKRPQEIDVTRAQLAQAVAEKDRAEQTLSIDQAQLRAGGIPQTELINAQESVNASAAKVRELEAALAVDSLPAREQQIQSQAFQVAADRASLATAQWRAEQKKIQAPRQGLVFDTLYREGEWVLAGNPVVQLLPPENYEVRFFVPESTVGGLKPGQRVTVQCDGCSANVSAVITFVSPQVEYTPPVIYSNENRAKLVFMVIAKPSNQDAVLLHPGQPVEVTLQ
jgi:HlyD family secretion protein